jgi:hypothetical protein
MTFARSARPSRLIQFVLRIYVSAIRQQNFDSLCVPSPSGHH